VKRNKINNNYFSIKRNPNKKLMEENTLSPSIQIGNRTYIMKEINFNTRGSGFGKENELFRDKNELDKKCMEINNRKIKSKSKNKILNAKEDAPVKTIEPVDQNQSQTINSELVKIKKYMQLINSQKQIKKSGKNFKNFSEANLNTIEINNNINKNNNKNISGKNLIKYKKLYNDKSPININKNYKDESENEILDNINNEKTFNINNTSNTLETQKIPLRIINYKINNNGNKDKKSKKIKLNYLIHKKKFYQIVNNKKLFNTPFYKYNHFNNNNPSKNNNTKSCPVFTSLIKNITTKDRRISISIKYYYLLKKNRNGIKSYNCCVPSDTLSLNFLQKIL